MFNMKSVEVFVLVVFLIAIKETVTSAVTCAICDNCTIPPSELKVCTGTYCFTKGQDGKVSRGCSEDNTCNPPAICEHCNDMPVCNNKPFNFPTCKDANNETEKCNAKTLCYYYANENKLRKGCLSNIKEDDPEGVALKAECTKNDSKLCKTCQGDDCNEQRPLRCVKCSKDEPWCTRQHGEMMEKHAELCDYGDKFCYVDNDETNSNSRGCRAECGEHTFCCKADSCNVKKYPENRRECFDEENKKSTAVCKDTIDNCYVSFENGKVIRGCVKNEGNTCTNTEGNCQVCHGDKCNKHEVCKNCDQADGSNCSSVLCPTDKCYAALKNTTIERRCANKDDKCSAETFCEMCSAKDCNAVNKPNDWLKCHQCDGKKCSVEIKEEPTYCTQYVLDDKCYTLVTVDGTRRGCRSDLERCEASERCATCVGAGCNGVATLPLLRCVQCDQHNDTHCGPVYDPALPTTVCVKPMPDGQPDQCYTHIKDNKRGCLSDVQEDKDCVSGNTCVLCKENACNTHSISAASALRTIANLVAAATIIAMLGAKTSM